MEITKELVEEVLKERASNIDDRMCAMLDKYADKFDEMVKELATESANLGMTLLVELAAASRRKCEANEQQ